VLHNSCCSRFTRRPGRLAVYERGPMPLFPAKLLTNVPVATARACGNRIEAVFAFVGDSIVTGLRLAPTALAMTLREYFSLLDRHSSITSMRITS
jgi:hypothetical protein